MQRYVLAFPFNTDGSQVALIRKNRPAWQAGRLNGAGGKDEPGETPMDALVREIWEELGLQSSPEDWRHFATVTGAGFVIEVYAAFLTQDRFDTICAHTDEAVVKASPLCASVERAALSNVPWLMRAALDPDCASGRLFLRANYQG